MLGHYHPSSELQGEDGIGVYASTHGNQRNTPSRTLVRLRADTHSHTHTHGQFAFSVFRALTDTRS